MGILSVALKVAGGVKKFIAKRAEKKDLRIQKKIDSAIGERQKLSEISAGLFGGEASAVKEAANALIKSKGSEIDAKQDGTIKGGNSSMNLPSWLIPVVAIIGAVLVLPKLLGGGRRR